MSSTTVKTIMTVAAGLLGAACFLPHAAPYAPFLTAVSGVLLGAAHVPQPGAKAELAATEDALQSVVGRE